MEYRVSIQIDGQDISAGTLYSHVRHGQESATFSYDAAYLADKRAFALSPDLPLVGGVFHTQGSRLFGAFEDVMPDRWGRNLLNRAERQLAQAENRTARTLFEHDLLAGVDDFSRQGAIRIWVEGNAVAQIGNGVPRELRIPALLAAADQLANNLEADVKDLVAAGSSLGGARPKASVIDEAGQLAIAKFPKPDELLLEDVSAWEKTALDIARLVGIQVPETRLLRVAERSVLLLGRFDRRKNRRIPYISALTAIQGSDGNSYSYLDLVAFLEEEGSRPDCDIRELWRRILLSTALGNTDDHMRNHGLLRNGTGWRLSPVFDINPSPGNNTKHLRSAIDFDNDIADPQCVVHASEWYRISHDEAIQEAKAMSRVLSTWRKVAAANGISPASIEYMASCMDSGVERLASVR